MNEKEIKNIFNQLEKASTSVVCCRSAIIIWRECVKNNELDRASKLSEEARSQAIEGAKAFVEASKMIVEIFDSIVNIEAVDTSGTDQV